MISRNLRTMAVVAQLTPQATCSHVTSMQTAMHIGTMSGADLMSIALINTLLALAYLFPPYHCPWPHLYPESDGFPTA
jgi:hypothetical protein